MTEIEIVDLCKKIKGNVVLEDIHMKLESGNIYGFRGQNGCGKTMLMRCICGLVIPTSGRVVINGEELHKDIKIPKSIGALIENPSFLPQYTGYQNLKMLASLTGNIKDDEIILALKRVALDEESVENVKKVLLELQEKDKLIVIACHDREELEYLCNVIYEIRSGRVVGMEMEH